MPVNWNLGIAPDVGGNAMNALLQGQSAGQQDRAQKAMADYAVNPTPDGLNALAPHNPQFVMQTKQAQAQAQEAAAKEAEAKQQENLKGVAKLFSGVTDEQSYQMARQTAQRMGMDVSEAPPNFDPNWVRENGMIMNYFAETPQALSTAGKQAIDEGFKPGTPEFHGRVMEIGKVNAMRIVTPQPGAGAMAYDPTTGDMKVIVAPNEGQAPFGAPAPGGNAPEAPPVQVQSIDEAKRLPPGTKFYDPQGVLRQVPGGSSGNAAGGFPAFSRAIIGQESGGRYGVANTEGSGAMGIGQIMPDTARALSRRIGRPYRPDLLAGTSPEARDYQNALTNAALQEAWEYGGGDVRKAAYYYFAGPDKKGWGPKTRQYGEDIMRRMGGR